MTSTQTAIFVDFPTEIGRSQKSHFLFRSNCSCFLACRLVDIFDEHYSFSYFLSKLCRALRGRLVRKGPQSCLGQEMKADIRNVASFLKPWAPGLPCTDPRFHRSIQQHALLWCTSESLDPIVVLGRNHCTGLSIATAMIHCELLPILILVSIEDDKEPLAFSSSWHLLAQFTARPSQRCELSEALSLRPTL